MTLVGHETAVILFSYLELTGKNRKGYYVIAIFLNEIIISVVMVTK